MAQNQVRKRTLDEIHPTEENDHVVDYARDPNVEKKRRSVRPEEDASRSQPLNLGTLPPEILELIIMRIPFDPKTFWSIRLVSPAFRAIVQPGRSSILFKEIARYQYSITRAIFLPHRTIRFKRVKHLPEIQSRIDQIIKRIGSSMTQTCLKTEADDWPLVVEKALVIWQKMRRLCLIHRLDEDDEDRYLFTTHSVDAQLLLRYLSVRLAHAKLAGPDDTENLVCSPDFRTHEFEMQRVSTLARGITFSRPTIFHMMKILSPARISERDVDGEEEHPIMSPTSFSDILRHKDWQANISVRSLLCDGANNAAVPIHRSSDFHNRTTEDCVGRLLDAENLEADDDIVEWFCRYWSEDWARKVRERLDGTASVDIDQPPLPGRTQFTNLTPAQVNGIQIQMQLMARMQYQLQAQALASDPNEWRRIVLTNCNVDAILDAELLDVGSKLRRSMKSIDVIFEETIAELDKMDKSLRISKPGVFKQWRDVTRDDLETREPPVVVQLTQELPS